MKADIVPFKVLGVTLHPYTMEGAVKFLEQSLMGAEQTFAVTANAEIVMMAREGQDYGELLEGQADVVFPDGAGVVWAGRYLGYKVPERVAGYDLFRRLLNLAAQKGYKCFFLGGKPGIAEEAALAAQKLYPGVQITGCRHGYFKPEEDASIVKEINDSGADLLFAALGAPKQEFWLGQYRFQLRPQVLMGIGGSFDVLAGKVQRAPLWMQKAGLEWFFRLLQQPSRFCRMLVLPKFVWQVLRDEKIEG